MKKLHVLIGDIHNCVSELYKIIEYFDDCNLVACGDLFDRGCNGVGVWELIHDFKIRCIRGNHEVKLLNYLEGRRDHLPSHYFQFLNRFVEQYDLQDLVDFIKSLPLMIKLDDHALVTHGGVIPWDPWREDISANVYGRFDPNKPMPKNPDDAKCWWNSYKEDFPVIYYGHITCNDIRIKYGKSGLPNSYGLDTAACHGNKLTAICHETKEIFQVKSHDYFGKIKGINMEPSKKILKFRKEYAAS